MSAFRLHTFASGPSLWRNKIIHKTPVVWRENKAGSLGARAASLAGAESSMQKCK